MHIWKTTVDPPKQQRAERRVAVITVLGERATEGRLQRRIFEREEVLVGRAAGEGELWFPDDERVSRRHALLRLDSRAGTAAIEDLSRGGTFVQGQKVSQSALNPGDVVRVGDSFFLVRFVTEADLANDATREVPELVGPSPALSGVRRALSLVGKSTATVVVLGESGTGKELVARALHDRSGRKGPFVAVNCAAIPETLMESQFFGHVSGAFTGAKAEARGWFRAAEGGTLFLDEIGELPLLMQPKLLRAVEERAVTPVGATEPVRCDVRIVAATNRDLSDRERFRGDLFARISEFVLEVPPLRERREDILPILLRLLDRETPELDPDLIETLLLHDYPHNARDVRRVATQLSVRGAGRELWDVSLLDRVLASSPPAPRTSVPASASSEPPSASELESEVRVPSREELMALLKTHRGVVADIARETGRFRKQVYRWLTQHGLSLDDYRSD